MLALHTTKRSSARKVRVSSPPFWNSTQLNEPKMPLDTVGQSTKETIRSKGSAVRSALLSHALPAPRVRRQ